MPSDEAEDVRSAADQLEETLTELKRVDLNPLWVADDVQTVLEAYDELQDVCLRLRDRQHAIDSDQEDV